MSKEPLGPTMLKRIAELKAEVERLKDVIEEAKDLLGDCKSLETPACNAYALLWKNSPCRVQRGPKP